MVESSCTISTESGRKIRIMESGTPDGVPILVHSGTPGSRLLYHLWVEDALSRGIRLISYERPGYGGSTPFPDRTVASAANDVAEIAKVLGINRLSVWGFSGGGPHALACAALLPDLVVSAATLGSLAPYTAEGLDWFAGMSEENVALYSAALKGRDDLQQLVEVAAHGILGADPVAQVKEFRSQLSPEYTAVLTEDFVEYLFSSIREGSKERRDGVIDDELGFIKPWGFDLGQIKVPVLLWHGKHDKSVPYTHGEWLSKHIPNIDARISPDDAHNTLAVRRVGDVHSWLLAKMA